jgi:hypothetical protein
VHDPFPKIHLDPHGSGSVILRNLGCQGNPRQDGFGGNMAKRKFEMIHTVTTADFYYVEAESEEEAQRMWDDDEIGPFAENSEPDHSMDVDGDLEISEVVMEK